MAFPTNCNPRAIVVDESCGCTLTRATIQGMTPQDFEDQGSKEIGMDKLIASAQMAKAAGYRESNLEMLLNGTIKGIKNGLAKQNISPSESVILPYIYRRQETTINANYWEVTAGVVSPDAGTNGVPAHAWRLTVRNSQSTYATQFTDITRFFVPGSYILVEHINSSTSAALSGAFKVLAVESAGSGIAYLTLEPNESTTGWASLTSAQKLQWQPTSGLAFTMANSVSDFESWCHNEAAVNNKKLLTFWVQTSRRSHCYNDEYFKALNAALTSGYFKEFLHLPLAEQRRQMEAKFKRDWLNSVWFGQAINEYQTVETYTSLPTVNDPYDPTCTLEYKANAIGFQQQLVDCGRVTDHSGGALDLDTLAASLYNVKRAREVSGGTVDRIDVMTNRWTHGAIQQLMITYYKAKYGTDIQRHYSPNEKLTFENQVELKYSVYQLPPDLGGFELAVYEDTFFDDKISAHPTATRSRGRALWAIDWSDVTTGIFGAQSVNRTNNTADDIYNCVITPNIRHHQLESTKWTSILENPNRHLIVHNFSDATPKLTVPGHSV